MTHRTLLGFLIWYRDRNGGSTRAFSGVKTALWNFTRELNLTWLSKREEHRTKRLIKELKYLDTTPINRKEPLTMDILRKVHDEWAAQPTYLHILAAMFLGHDALLRSSELLALRTTDILWMNPHRMRIAIARSKTHREGAAQLVYVSDRPGPSSFKLVRQIQEENPQHKGLLLGGGKARNWLANGIKKAVQLVGLNPAVYSTHSLRAGGATDLLCAGIPREIIQKAGRWNSDEVLKYLRDECFIADTCAKAFAKL